MQRFHLCSILAQKGCAADVIRNASVVEYKKPGSPLTNHILVTYMLLGDRIPSTILALM